MAADFPAGWPARPDPVPTPRFGHADVAGRPHLPGRATVSRSSLRLSGPAARRGPALLGVLVLAILGHRPRRRAPGLPPDPPPRCPGWSPPPRPHQAEHRHGDGRRHAHRRPALHAAVRRLLVGQGLSFRNSFSPYPLCCPARASFLTGRYAHNHHVLLPRGALRLRVLRRPRHGRHRAPAERLPDRLRREVPQRVRRRSAPWSPAARRSATSRPAGPTGTAPSTVPPAAATAPAAPTTTCTRCFNVNGTHRRHPPGRVPDQRPGPVRPRAGARSTTAPPGRSSCTSRPSHRTSAAPTRRATRCTSSAAAAASAGSPPRPGRRWVRGTFDRQIPRASGLPVGRRPQRGGRLRQAAADERPARAEPPRSGSPTAT